MNRLVLGVHPSQDRPAYQHSGDQLAQHRRLTQPLGHVACDLGDTQHDNQHGQEL